MRLTARELPGIIGVPRDHNFLSTPILFAGGSMYRPVRFVLTCVMLSAIVSFAADVVVFGPETFTRATGAPRIVTRTFRVSSPSGSYVLRVANQGVTSAVI